MSTQSNPSATLGTIGETFVADWLLSRRWTILHRRWHCRWGELDIIAQLPDPSSIVSFIEVKVRSRGNWDANGLLAITPAKQTKLWKSAQLFLVSNPSLADRPCRFDVALVACRPAIASPHHPKLPSKVQQPSKAPDQTLPSITQAGYKFCLQHYIPNAFMVDAD